MGYTDILILAYLSPLTEQCNICIKLFTYSPLKVTPSLSGPAWNDIGIVICEHGMCMLHHFQLGGFFVLIMHAAKRVRA